MRRFSAVLLLGMIGVACSPVDPPQIDMAPSPDLASPPAPALSLVAGGLGGSGSTDGTGALARFDVPAGMAIDGAGNMYVADSANHTIRKVVLANGTVTTLAGMPGITGTADGTGAAARFNEPRGLALDGVGNLYVAESANHTIRKVDVATGAVTTLAGSAGSSGSTDGMGASARFNAPWGVTLGGAGTLYVADTDNHTIRQVVATTGAVTTLAGMARMSGSTNGSGTAARFNFPWNVTADNMGNLYVADSWNHTLRKVVIAGAVVTTIVGLAGSFGSDDGIGTAARLYRPQGVALDSAGNLYVADTDNYTIRKVVLFSGVVTTLAGTAEKIGSDDGVGVAARFRRPVGMVLDSTGNLFVTDILNHTIRKVVVATGAVTTLAGTPPKMGSDDLTGPAARFDAPTGMAADSTGNVYVADTYSQMIRKVAVATGVVTTVAGSAKMVGKVDGTGSAARFLDPAGMAIDGAGNLYVADTGNHTIRKIVIATGAVTTLAGTAQMSGSVDGTGAAARFLYPKAVAVDSAGNLYVADMLNEMIRKVVVATGVVTTVAGTPLGTGSTDGIGAAARFRDPEGIAVDSAGDVYVADTGNHTIRKLEVATGNVTTVAGTARSAGSMDSTGPSARFSSPQRMAFDGTGGILIADNGNGTIRKFQVSDRSVTTVVGIAGQHKVVPGPLPGQLNRPTAVALLPMGGIAILDENSVLLAR